MCTPRHPSYRWSLALMAAVVIGVLGVVIWPSGGVGVQPKVGSVVAGVVPPAVGGRAISGGTGVHAVLDGGTNPQLHPPVGRGIGPDPQLAPRDPDEWQGMLINMSFRARCQDSAGCGLALACREDGLCGPCVSDVECAVGEACVLQHCILGSYVECRYRRDCRGGEEMCILVGEEGGPRGNEGLRAICESDRHIYLDRRGRERAREELERARDERSDPRSLGHESPPSPGSARHLAEMLDEEAAHR